MVHNVNYSFSDLFPAGNTLPTECPDTYDDDVFQYQTQVSDQETLYPQLLNSVPLKQRSVVAAMLQQRQAQRIRSKSVIYQNHPIIQTEEGRLLFHKYLILRK